MKTSATKFDDGVAYEAWMGRWSRIVGEKFLTWLSPRKNLSWVDVGCGNGALTELVHAKYDPTSIHGVDPSQEQLDVARSRVPSDKVEYKIGTAQELPLEDNVVDVAVMALAINLPPDPRQAVAEMVRVTKAGGIVATYMWDIPNGGITMEPIRVALKEMGVDTPIFGEKVTTPENMLELWHAAGLKDVSLTRIDITLSYRDFNEFWISNTGTDNTVVRAIKSLSEIDVEVLKANLNDRLINDSQGGISYGAFTNAVRGKA
ncbi:MAG TPA: SAM-dependent methyltransferase [Rhodospirillaceae bacterium]|nr:SAM-dependent methyltransferase [Rhodospirillaceae bacterium]